MKLEEAEPLWAAWLERKLEPRQEKALIAALLSDPALRRSFLEDTACDGILRARSLAEQDATDFVAEVTRRSWAEGQGVAFLASVQDRLTTHDKASVSPARRLGRSFWVCALIAMSCAAAFRQAVSPPLPGAAARVLWMRFNSTSERPAGMESLEPGSAVPLNRRLRVPSGGRLCVRLANSRAVDFEPESSFSFQPDAGGATRIVLFNGSAGLRGIARDGAADEITSGNLIAKTSNGVMRITAADGGAVSVDKGHAEIVALPTGTRACARAGERVYLANGKLRLEAAAPVREAADFTSSIGICTHLEYWDTPYARFAGLVKPRLQELGISHLRDGLVNQVDTVGANMRELGRLGFRMDLILSPRHHPPQTALAIVAALGAVVETIEPSPTPDRDTSISYHGEGFPEWVRDYQSDIYQAFHSNRGGSGGLPVLAPSLAESSNGERLSLSHSCDMANAEWLPSARDLPEAMPDSVRQGAVSSSGPGKPLAISAAGWHTDSLTGEADPWHTAVSEAAAAQYTVRLLLDSFRHGTARIYLYELIDAYAETPGRYDREAHFGLLRNDGTPKPAFYAVRNLISLAGLHRPEESSPPHIDIAPASAANDSLSLDFTGDVYHLEYLCLHSSADDVLLFLWRSEKAPDEIVGSDFAAPIREVEVHAGGGFLSKKLCRFVPKDLGWSPLEAGRAAVVRVGSEPVALLLHRESR